MAEISKEMNESTLKAFGEFLKPEQITRLKQISYQTRGCDGVQRPRGRQEAEPHRRSEDRHPDDRHRSPWRRCARSSSQNQDDREAGMKKMAELRKETLAKVAAKLNDEQQKTWKELLGAPFEIKYEPRPQ